MAVPAALAPLRSMVEAVSGTRRDFLSNCFALISENKIVLIVISRTCQFGS